MALEYVTEENFKNNAGKYIDMLSDENINVIITRDGEEVGRLIPKSEVIRSLVDELTGILNKEYDIDEERTKALRAKYGLAN